MKNKAPILVILFLLVSQAFYIKYVIIDSFKAQRRLDRANTYLEKAHLCVLSNDLFNAEVWLKRADAELVKVKP